MRKVIFLFALVLLISSVSAATWDDIKRYDSDTKTVRIVNALGFGDEIGNATLKTPLINYVPIGKNMLVAEITIGSAEEYTDALTSMEFYEANNGNKKVDREFEYKVKEKLLGVRDVYSKECRYNANGICVKDKIGTESYEYYGWSNYGTTTIPKGEITIGIFIDVKAGDYIEWIPTIFGNHRVEEWAIYAADPANLVYYKLDEGIGTIAANSVNTKFQLGLINTPAWVDGKIGNATFYRSAQTEYAENATFSGLGRDITVSYWINVTSFTNDNEEAVSATTGDDATFRGFSIQKKAGSNSFNFYVANGATFVEVTSPVIAANTWYHYVLTTNATHARVFLNGTLVNTVAVVFNPANPVILRLGRHSTLTDAARILDGAIDEVYILNRTVDQSEVNSLFNNYNGNQWPFLAVTSVNLTNPVQSSAFTSVTGRTFNSTATISSGTSINATLYIYTQAGALIGTNFTNDVANNKSNFTMPNLGDGIRLWNIQMCGDDGSCKFAPSNFTYTIDSTNPVVRAIVPANKSYIYPYNTSNVEFNLNISIVDTNIGTCYFNSSYDSALTITACNVIRRVNLTNVFGLQTLFVFGNDTVGNTVMNTTSIILPRPTHNRTANVLTTEGYSLNSSYFDGLTASSISFSYNNTAYSTSIVTDGAGNTIASKALSIPVISGTIPLYWNTTLSNGTVLNSAIYNQTVTSVGIDDCTAFTNVILNFTNYDQDTKAVLSVTNYSVQVRIGDAALDNYVQYANTSNSLHYDVCSNQTLTSSYRMDAIAQTSRGSYFTQYYNIQNFTLTNLTANRNISLYQLQTNAGETFQINVKDTNFISLTGALIEVQRQYVSEGGFTVVEIPITDSQGSAIAHLKTNNQLYNIYIKKNGLLVAVFLNQQPYCNPALSDCVINYNLLASDIVPATRSSVGGVFWNNRYNDTSRIYYLDFSSIDGTTKTVRIAGSYNGAGVCSQTLTASSGTVSCSIPAAYSNKTVLMQGYSGSSLLLTDYVYVGYTSPKLLSKGKYIIAALLLPLLALMAGGAASVSVIAFVLGLGLAGSIFLIDGGISIFGASTLIVWFVAAAILLLIKINVGGPKNG